MAQPHHTVLIDYYLPHRVSSTVLQNALVVSAFALLTAALAQVRSATPRRWRDKDLAALYFSALDIGLTRRDKLRFLKSYFAAAGNERPLRQILREEAALLLWLQRKADRLLVRYARKYAPGAKHE